MAKQSEQILEEQDFFLRNQFWILTIQAAFSRAYVYKPNSLKESKNETDRQQFKQKLFEYVESDILKLVTKANGSPEAIFRAISNLKDYSKEIYSEYLTGGSLKIGVCQKIINLYLKYLWCANKINFTPPHFPLDRLIQENSLKKVLLNWTELDELKGENSYEEVINKLQTNSNKAEWELIKYNDILRNG